MKCKPILLKPLLLLPNDVQQVASVTEMSPQFTAPPLQWFLH